jgi:hypothetical protein
MTELTLFSVQDIAVPCGVDIAFVERLVELGVIGVDPAAARGLRVRYPSSERGGTTSRSLARRAPWRPTVSAL